jgi:hypothetical protein
MIIVSEAESLTGGPKGRHEIAMSVRAWSGRHPNDSRRPEGPTPSIAVSTCRAAPSAFDYLDWFLIHDLTVVATSSRPFGPHVIEGMKY